MPSASTETCSITFPSTFENIEVKWETIQAESQTANGQWAFLSVGLQELSFYNKFQGADLLARFQESCLAQRGTVELVADKTLTIANLRSDIRTVQSPEGYFYYFGLVPISEEYGYTVIGDCDKETIELFEPLFDETWQTLHYFGNPAEALNKQQAALNNMLAKHAAPMQDKSVATTPFTIPDDNLGYWHIGEHIFTPTGTTSYIDEGNGAMYVQTEAQAPGYINPGQSDIISEYDERKVYLRFYFKGIYNAGIPTGSFHLKNDNSPLCSFWKGGFQYSQHLTAEVTLAEGWLGIHGHLNNYPVKLAIKPAADTLNWNKYCFLSTEEINTASPDIVQHVQLTDPDPAILEQTLQPLKQLKTLQISYTRNNTQAGDFKEIPQAVKHLQELETLSLTGVSALRYLPHWLGNLKKLKSITLQNSSITEIPDAALQLPVLKKLYLRNNQLQSVPETLPETLETLILPHNQLITLPASARNLQHLNIEHNPLQQLPAGLENIPQLNLELEKKITLLDYSYKGADKQGTIPYNNNIFYAINDTELSLRLRNTSSHIANEARTSVSLATTEEDTYTEKGNHRFGGLPDLPVHIPYPTFINFEGQQKNLQFITQINCTTIAHLQQYLPRTGMLYFFVDTTDEMLPRVLYYNGNDLQSARELNMQTTTQNDSEYTYTPFRAEAGKYISIPHHTSEQEEQPQNLLKNPVHSINSHVFKQHGTPEKEAADKRKGKPEEWMVLLQVSSDNNPGFNFWDAGVLYFVIHKSDLKKEDFSNVYCGLESS